MKRLLLRRRPFPGKFILAVWALLLIALTADPTRADVEGDRWIAAFAMQHCSECHGPDGHGTKPIFPKLAGQNTEYLVRQMLAFQRGIRKGTLMTYRLQELNVHGLIALAVHFNKTPRRASEIKDPTHFEAGRLIYQNGNAARGIAACANCHGPSGGGGGRMPRLSGQHAEYIADQLFRFINSERLPGQVPTHPIANLLSDDDVDAVSVYLSGVD